MPRLNEWIPTSGGARKDDKHSGRLEVQSLRLGQAGFLL
jgi:hypothetical protein